MGFEVVGAFAKGGVAGPYDFGAELVLLVFFSSVGESLFSVVLRGGVIYGFGVEVDPFRVFYIDCIVDVVEFMLFSEGAQAEACVDEDVGGLVEFVAGGIGLVD
jgi:hypothetical protein